MADLLPNEMAVVTPDRALSRAPAAKPIPSSHPHSYKKSAPCSPENVRTAADARKIVEERKLDHVKVGVFDNDGIMRGKYMGRDKFFSALDKGFGFCDVVLGWDSNDQLYDNVKYTGWHTAYPDAPVRVLPDTCRDVPFEGDMIMFLGEFAEKAEAVCPRATLRRVLKKADDLGYKVNAATEFEFFMFKETPESVRAKASAI